MPAGKIAFDVTNQGSAKVTEFYVKKHGRNLGEVEDVVPGQPKTLTLTLKVGSYTTRCPNGSPNEEGTLEVVAPGRTTTSVKGTNQPSGSITPGPGGNTGGGVQPGATTTPNVTTSP